MSKEKSLENVKKLREITGVGFKDCKLALDENNGDINKSIEYLRKKGIAKAGKRMGKTAAEGLVCIYENKNKFSMIEINSETDFVAKNNEFINFAEEVSQLSLSASGKMENITGHCFIPIFRDTLGCSYPNDHRTLNFPNLTRADLFG